MTAPLLDEGGYPAILYQIVDLGLQPGSQQYPEEQYKMAFNFECLDEFMLDDDGKELLDTPRTFDYEVSYNPDGFMGERSNIHKVMTAMEGFDKDLEDILYEGTILTVNLKQQQPLDKKKDMYNKVTGVVKMREKDLKKHSKDSAILPQMFFELNGAPTKEMWEQVSKRGGKYSHQSKIQNCLELWSEHKTFATEIIGLTQPEQVVVENGQGSGAVESEESGIDTSVEAKGTIPPVDTATDDPYA